jgi:antirestriction protein ArdC/phage/plasmid primase-like uncharacterized protein/predicted RNA methylase
MIALQELEEDYARVQGRAPYRVSEEDLGPDVYGKLGKGEIIVNSRFVTDTQFEDVPAFRALSAVIHEGRHAFQLAAIDGYAAHDNQSEVEKWKENLVAYIDARKLKPGYYYAYRLQPLERDAHDFALKEMQGIYGELEHKYGRINSLGDYFENITLDKTVSADLARYDLGPNFLERLDGLIHEDYEKKVEREPRPPRSVELSFDHKRGSMAKYPVLSEEQNTLSSEEQSYVEESRRQRIQLERQGQQNAFSGANMPGGEPATGQRSPGALHRVPERVPFTTIGKAFQDIERQPVQIIGQQVKSFADVADLAQGWRNPNYEEMRYIYVKNGVVVDHEGVTCRLPGSTSYFTGNVDDYVGHLRDRSKALDADQIYALHNHPTGDPKPSAADVQVTRYLCKVIPEMVGHVVINSGKYSLIGPDGQFEILPLENLPDGWKDPILQPSKPHEALNDQVNSAQKIAGWAKALTKDRGLPVLIYLGAGLQVRGLQEISASALANVALMREKMPEKLLEFGSTSAALALPDHVPEELLDAAVELVQEHYVLLDAVGNRPGGDYFSLQSGIESAERHYDFVGGQPKTRFPPQDIRERKGKYHPGPGPKQLNLFDNVTIKHKDTSISLEPRYALAQSLSEKLDKDGEITSKWLTAEADRIFGGTQADGVYSGKDAFDAMEAAFSLHIARKENPAWNNTDAEWAGSFAKELNERVQKLPTQTRRDPEMDEFQQFSTPPALAFVVNWVANVLPYDVVLEPSAGTGDLAIWPQMAGAKVVLNELSERRRDLLSNLFPEARLFKENAEQLHNVLPADVSPTVIVMNPPFSASAGRIQGERDTKTCARHIEQALKRLQNNGRLVAIAGEGMAADRPTFTKWWKEIEGKYNVRANIGISGKEYAKYGTTFDNQILVIDKTGSTTQPVLTGRVHSVSELPRLLEGIKNDRERIKRSIDQPAVEKDSQKVRDFLQRNDRSGEPHPDLGGTGSKPPGHTGVGRTDAVVDGLKRQTGTRNVPHDGIGAGGELRDGALGDIGGGGIADSRGDTGVDKGAGRVAIEGRGEEKPVVFDIAISRAIRDKTIEKITPFLVGTRAEENLFELVKSEASKAFGDVIAARMEGGPDLLPIELDYLNKWDKEDFAGSVLGYLKEQKLWAPPGENLSEKLGEAALAANKNPEPPDLVPILGTNRNGADAGSAGSVVIEAISGQASEFTESIFAQYVPQRLSIPGAAQHPGKLVQSAAMSAVDPPAPTYSPTLPDSVIKDGFLSLAQLEALVYAGQAHSGVLPNGDRKGFFIGDGTGVGKGREISGIILDNLMQGRTKAVWISASEGLIEDARRDFAGIGGDPGKIFSQGKTKTSGEITQKEGILFTTYTMLRSGEKKQANDLGQKAGKTRAEQIIEWLGKDFDGVIAFDEAHSMGNATPVRGKRGLKKPSQQAIAGVNLQHQLPDARIVYVSATGATEVSNLSYANRLGLWGEGTAFADVQTFIDDVSRGGIASMELISRDMKAMGMYVSRSLSYDGVSYERLEHTLSPLQEDIYNELAGAWQVVLGNVNEALDITHAGHDSKAKSAALSRFWGSHQRFFNQVITAMQTPRVIDDMREQLAAGNAVVIQLVNTNEAAQERIVADAVANNTEIEDLDFTPRQMLIDYVRNGFPVAAYEATTDADGKVIYTPVLDSEGNQVFDKDAIALRDGLIGTLEQIRVPENPLDSIINAFGSERVAEVTGRSRRFVQVRDDEGNFKVIEEKRGKNAAMADASGFQNDRKDILVFSGAGGTGFTFSSDRTAINQRKRIHYILQPGWRADNAVQGFGRTHRTNQANEPHYVLPTTNLHAQKRFVSSIARRLDQLGALTRGQRDAGSQGLFTAADNLESEYAGTAVRNLFKDLRAGKTDLSFEEVTKQMGLNLTGPDGGFDETKIPPVSQFLNRLLSLKTDMQNTVFSEFEDRLIESVQFAKQQGLFDEGLQTIKALNISKTRDEVVYEDKNTGAKTRYVELAVTNAVEYEDWKDAKLRSGKRRGSGDFSGWFVSKTGKTRGQIFYLKDIGTRLNSEGYPVRRGSIHSIRKNDPKYIDNVEEIDQGAFRLIDGRYQKVELARRISEREAEKLWKEQIAKAPRTVTKTERMIVGAILPIWDRVEGAETIKRLQTDDGEQLLGRVLGLKGAKQTLRNLGVGSDISHMSSQDLFAVVKAGSRAILANGWEVSTSRVNFEDRIEIKGRSAFTYAEQHLLQEQGAFVERINWKERVFIPAGASGVAAFERITASKPVIDLLGETPVPSGNEIEPELLAYRIPAMAGPADEVIREGDKGMAKYTVLALDKRTGEEALLGEFDTAPDAYSAFITAVETTSARVINEEGALLAGVDAGRSPVFHDPQLEALHREAGQGRTGPTGVGTSHYEKVAAKLISLLERKLAPWQKGWKPGENSLPHNPVSGTRYRGGNLILLAAEAIDRGYNDPRWLTYKQAEKIGAQVKRGEKGTRVEYWKFEDRERLLDDNGQPVLDDQGKPVVAIIEKLSRPKMFSAVVFNAEQIQNMPAFEERSVTWSADERAENILKNSGAKIFHDQNDRAFYRPGTDSIHLPHRSQFDSVEAYYAVALHELSHWTGEKSRLDRDLGHPFGSIGYAKEELRAEIASFMLGEELRVGHDPENHAAYVKSWIQILQDDPKELFRASAAAEKIMDYVLDLEIEKEQEVKLMIEGHETDRGRDAAVAAEPILAQMDTYIDVRYIERMEAKALGAKWDKAAKSWYVPAGNDLRPFERWPEKSSVVTAPKVDPKQEYAAALIAAGLRLEGLPLMDGKLHRVPVEGDRAGAKSGAYRAFTDGRPAGMIQNWKTGLKTKWVSSSKDELSPEERTNLLAEAALKRIERQKEIERVQEQKAVECAARLSKLREASSEHPYLARKGVDSYGLYVNDHGDLVVPLQDVDGKVWSLQRIKENGEKPFEKNARKQGCFHLIGELREAEQILIAEGYATAASVYQATGRPVVVAMDSGNLIHVAKALHEAYPEKGITILGDDDRHLPKRQPPLPNAGREKALEAAREVEGNAIFPTFLQSENGAEFTDFNDLARARGLECVERQVEFEVGLAMSRVHELRGELEHAREAPEVDRELDEREYDRGADMGMGF